MDLREEMFRRKQSYVESKLKRNSLVDSLTEEQHDTLAQLCSIRHDVHCNQEDFFYSENANFEIFWNYIEGDEDASINAMLQNVELPSIDWEIDSSDYDFDFCFYEGVTDYTGDTPSESPEFQEALKNILDMAKKFNYKIEDYLFSIDQKHGTEYCPTGFARLK